MAWERTCIFGSQYWGKKETELGEKRSVPGPCAQAFLLLSSCFFWQAFSTSVAGAFTTDQTIIEAGLSYLAIIRFTYFFFAVTQILLATRAVWKSRGIAFGLSVMTLIINCGIGHHGKNDRFRRSEACKTLFQETSETFCIHGNYLRRVAFFIRIPVLSLYQLSPETREMANTFLIILSVVMVGMSYQMPTNGGIIRGSGSIALFHEGGSDQYLGDCDPVIHVHGICGQKHHRPSLFVPQCRSDL